MRYENFEKIKTIVDKIHSLQEKLNQIEGDVYVKVTYRSGVSIYTIGTDDSYEHDYTPLAIQLVESIKCDLKNRISSLKEELKEL